MTLFCDLDGVLADFNRGIEDITGHQPHDMPIRDMWRAAADADEFFYRLNWMSDGEALWNAIADQNPTVLTGIPMGGWASGQKKKWCGEQLGWHVPVITCWSKEKCLYGKSGDILIDDMLKAKAPWENMGGIFIHHTSTEDTLRKLNKHL